MAEQDRYEPKERLATGLGGERWRALDTRTGTDVVMAVLDARTATAAERTRFAAVAEAGVTLNHPGLEKVTDRGTTSLGNPFLVHEIVEAPTFAKRIDAMPPWSIHEVVRVGTSMLDALSVAHAAGLVHGDLEPERVQVLPAGRARVTCFDLSRASQRIADESWHSSFAYMSPEQANGEPPTAASDVFGVGALIYRAITGISPRASADGSSSRERIIEARLAEVRSLRGEIPLALANAVDRALASEPKVRFTSAAELRKALTSALILSPTVARMHVRAGVTAATPASDHPRERSHAPARGESLPKAAPSKAASASPKPASAAPTAASAAPKPAPAVKSAAPQPVAQVAARGAAPKSPTVSDEGEFLDDDDLELEPLDEDEEEQTKIRQRSEPPPPIGEPVPEPPDEAPPVAAKNEVTRLARVQVKQVNVQRAGGPITQEDVPIVVRRRDPRAELSDRPPAPEPAAEPSPVEEPVPAAAAPEPAPAPKSERPPLPKSERPPLPKSERPPLPKSERPPAPKSERPPLPKSERPTAPKSDRPRSKSNRPPAPRSEFPDAPSAFASERPPAAPAMSRGALMVIGAVSLGTIVAVIIALRTWGSASVAPLPPRNIPEPEQASVLPSAEPDAAIAEIAPPEADASVAIDAAPATAAAPPVIPEPVAPPPSVTTMSTTMATTPMTVRMDAVVTTMTTTPVTTTTMVTAPVMTEPAMTTMVDTTMRHIETDPGF